MSAVVLVARPGWARGPRPDVRAGGLRHQEAGDDDRGEARGEEGEAHHTRTNDLTAQRKSDTERAAHERYGTHTKQRRAMMPSTTHNNLLT